MSLPRYAAYKPSGVEWFGEVPNHWQAKRLKTEASYCVSNVDKVPSDDELPVRLCNYTDVYYNDQIMPDMGLMETTATAEEIRKFGLRVNDVLITKDSEEWSDIAVPAMVAETAPDLVCGYHLAIIRPAEGRLLGKFLLRTLQSSAVNQQFQIAASGVTRYGLPKSSIGEAWLPLPPLEEQKTIANFLDAQTAKIDTLLAKKRQLIAKLKEKRSALIARTVTRGLPVTPAKAGADAAKAAGLVPKPAMKDSGVEWLGNIPAHWNVRPIRYLFKNLDSKRIPLSGEDRATLEKLYPYYGASGIIDQVDEYIFDEPLILVAEDGANLLSRSSPLAFLATGKYWVNNHAHILHTIIGDISYWVSVLQTFDFTPLVTGAAQPKLTADRLGGIRLPVPPAEEQQAIAAYLDRETARIDQLAAKVEAAIARLTEYRQALITSAVTGKIDVSQYNTQKGAQHATVTLS